MRFTQHPAFRDLSLRGPAGGRYPGMGDRARMIAPGGPFTPGAYKAGAAPGYAPGQGLIGPNMVIYGVAGLAVAIGATVDLIVRPQQRHVPETLVVSVGVAGNFQLEDIRVGVAPLLGTTGAIPLDGFVGDQSIGIFLPVVCEVGTDVTLTVTNTSAAIADFICRVQGSPAMLGN